MKTLRELFNEVKCIPDKKQVVSSPLIEEFIKRISPLLEVLEEAVPDLNTTFNFWVTEQQNVVKIMWLEWEEREDNSYLQSGSAEFNLAFIDAIDPVNEIKRVRYTNHKLMLLREIKRVESHLIHSQKRLDELNDSLEKMENFE